MSNHIAKFELEPGVTVFIYPEPDPDWSWETDEATLRKIRRGDLEQVIVEVVVFDRSGEIKGTDSLGGVVIGADDHKQEIRDTIEAHAMVEEARRDLAERLKRIVEKNQEVSRG